MTGRSRKWLPASTTQFGQSFPNFHQEFLLQTPFPRHTGARLIGRKKLQERMRRVGAFFLCFSGLDFLAYTRGNCHPPQHCEVRHVENEFMECKFRQFIYQEIREQQGKKSAHRSKASSHACRQEKPSLTADMCSIPRHGHVLESMRIFVSRGGSAAVVKVEHLTPLTWAQTLPSQHPRLLCYPPCGASSATIQTPPPSTAQPQHNAQGVTFKFRPANLPGLPGPSYLG